MASQAPQYPVSPLENSPTSQRAGPEYISVPPDEALGHRRNQQSSFRENIEPGLGIQMTPPKSSTIIHYVQDAKTTPGLAPSPFMSPRPPFDRTPDTLYSFGSAVSRRTDPITERLIAHRATQISQWHIHWRTPAIMVFAFFLGVILALCQHFLYSWLHHRHIKDEDRKFKMVLYGRALAYLAKVAFGGCVVLVFRQRIWRTFRERALTVMSVDQLFGATEDPSLFGNWEAIQNAPLVVGIAAVIWLIPLATIIFSPGALTFGNYVESEYVLPTTYLRHRSQECSRSTSPHFQCTILTV
jgi:hypothetical protein